MSTEKKSKRSNGKTMESKDNTVIDIPAKTKELRLTEEEMLRIDLFSSEGRRVAAERAALSQAERALNAEETILRNNQSNFFGAIQNKYNINLKEKQINPDGTVVDREATK